MRNWQVVTVPVTVVKSLPFLLQWASRYRSWYSCQVVTVPVTVVKSLLFLLQRSSRYRSCYRGQVDTVPVTVVGSLALCRCQHTSYSDYVQLNNQGQFSEADLQEWMPFVIVAATSGPVSVQALVHAVYNSGSWTQNCEAVQMPILLQLQNLPWKGDAWWKKKCLYIVFWFWLTRRWRVRRKNARATSYCLFPDTLWLRASKKKCL